MKHTIASVFFNENYMKQILWCFLTYNLRCFLAYNLLNYSFGVFLHITSYAWNLYLWCFFFTIASVFFNVSLVFFNIQPHTLGNNKLYLWCFYIYSVFFNI